MAVVNLRVLDATDSAALKSLFGRFVGGDGERQIGAFPRRWLTRFAQLERDLAAVAPGFVVHRVYDVGGLRMTVSVDDGVLEGDAVPAVGRGLVSRRDAVDAILEQARLDSKYWDDPPRPLPRDPRPVVALDVDGVLNALSPGAGLVEFELTVAVGQGPVSPFVRGGGRSDITALVRIDPLVVEWVNDLHNRAQVVWATTWEHAANTVLAPAVGLAPFDVAVSVERNPPRVGSMQRQDSTAWKADALLEQFANRPLVWVDDLAAPYRAPSRWRHPDDHAKTLVLVPDKDRGMTSSDMCVVDEFVAMWSAATRFRPG